MSDSDLSDDDDLFADFDKAECDQVNVSANLIDDIEDNVAQKSKDATDDSLTAGGARTQNSLTVTQAASGQHWYRDDDFKNLPDTNRSTKVDWVNMPSRGDVAGSAPPASSAASSSTPANTTAFMQQQPSPKMATTDMMTWRWTASAGGTVTACAAPLQQPLLQPNRHQQHPRSFLSVLLCCPSAMTEGWCGDRVS